MALQGQRISHYEVDDKGITVHELGGGKRSSLWTNVPHFYKNLKQQPQPQSGTPDSESTQEIITLDDRQQSSESRLEVDGSLEDIEIPQMPTLDPVENLFEYLIS